MITGRAPATQVDANPALSFRAKSRNLSLLLITTPKDYERSFDKLRMTNWAMESSMSILPRRNNVKKNWRNNLMADLAQKESTRAITKIFVKLKFNDFTHTTAEPTGPAPTLQDFRSLLAQAFARTGKPVRLIGVGVRFAETMPESAQIDLL
jgi:nucleotidyltransferase/DNA polymerase involved in DNA repair